MFNIQEYTLEASIFNKFQSLEWFHLELKLRELGFTVYRSNQDGWHVDRDNWRIWQVRQGWQSAQLIDGSYCNHKICKGHQEGLEEAINRVLSTLAVK
jgi:hypothetical protein